MKLIALTQNKFAQVDDKDFDYISQWKWSYSGQYAHRASGKNNVYLHRLLMGNPVEQVDHKDTDKLNCQRNNLRLASHSENSRNKQLQRNNTSGYKGVSWYKAYGKWEAKIKYNGHTTKLGYFKDSLDAARAYNDAAQELHGDFARLNNV